MPSATTAASLPAFYARLPPAVVCPNGVDPACWQSSPRAVSEARSAFGLPERYVLHVGARRLHKNQAVLIEALASLPGDVGLVLLGHHDPRVADPLDELARRFGVADRIVALDDVGDTGLAALYAGASVLAFPSTAEGFGLPPLEAMAASVRGGGERHPRRGRGLRERGRARFAPQRRAVERRIAGRPRLAGPA